MNRLDIAVFSTITICAAVFIAALFMHNLPNWCATPTVGGNYLVQPLCH